MPQIGWFEILIIVVVAILVIGPKDFPNVLKKIGSWIGSIKRYVTNIQKDITSIDIENMENKSEKNKTVKKDNEQQG